MTPQIATVLAILLVAIALFITEKVRMDLVALLVLGALTVTGLVTPSEALSGFSSPAVVTVWAVFMISGGLAQTGVASVIGRQITRLGGTSELRLVAAIMFISGVMSAFMNNVAVAALLLPVVMDIARRTKNHPSKLLMPLAFGSLLGGLTTLIGTPPNILISDILNEYNLLAFGLFDYTPVGLTLLIAGILFMTFLGRGLLPARDVAKALSGPEQDLEEVYEMQERLFVIRVPAISTLVGETLAHSRIGSTLGLNVIAIIRGGRTQLSPEAQTILHPGDELLVAGKEDRLAELRELGELIIENTRLDIQQLVSKEISIFALNLPPGSSLIDQTLRSSDFRRRHRVNVLAIRRDGEITRTKLQDIPLRAGDDLLLQGSLEQQKRFRDQDDFVVSDEVEVSEIARLSERLFAVRVPEGSSMAGKSLAESHLGEASGVIVLGIVHDGESNLVPEPSDVIDVGDVLLVEGQLEEIHSQHALRSLEIDRDTKPRLDELESESVGLAEAVLSPHNNLDGKTLREIHFREKYGLNVLAIWRGGRAYRSKLQDFPLRFGDALLLYGPRAKLRLLDSEPDFLVLIREAAEALYPKKAPIALLVLLGVLLPVMFGWLPIAISAVIGAALMILTGCLSMDEAYRQIEWRAVFLIAGMLPLGLAMEQTGAARFLADGVIGVIGSWGPLAVLAGIFLLTSLATQAMPSAAVAVLLAPIALNTAGDLNISPYTLMMAVAIAASASFLSPVSHPANVLILGPGGYKFSDYIKAGLPLTLVVLVVVLLVLPIFWPLTP